MSYLHYRRSFHNFTTPEFFYITHYLSFHQIQEASKEDKSRKGEFKF